MSGAFERLTGFVPLDPWALWLAPLVVAAALWLRRRPSAAVDFAPAALLENAEPLPATWRTRLLPVVEVCSILGLLLLVVALARPVFRERLPREAEGIDILLCVDVSSSMRAEDLAAGRTRLDVAKEAARRFVAGRPHDRVGLLTFARFADAVCPPTLDHVALGRLLDDAATVDPDGPEDATAIGAALARAAQTLKGGPSATKVAVLLTDGSENVATPDAPAEIPPAAAAQLAQDYGVRVYTIVAGEGDLAPDGVRIPLDTSAVRRAAERTGGRFFAARDAAAMRDVYAAIDAYETTHFEEPRYRTEERFARFVLAALLLFGLGRLLRTAVGEVLP